MPSLKTFAEKTGLPRQRRWKDVYSTIKRLSASAPKPSPAPVRAPQPPPAAQAPAIVKAAPEIEEVARYLARGFHDWDAERNWPPKHHYLEPGVRTLHDYIHAQTGKAVTELDPQWHTEAAHLRFTPNPDFPIRRGITVKLDGLRDDWEDDFRRALDLWAKFGLTFIEVNHWQPDYGRMNYLPDIIADDERAGSYLFSNFSTAIDGVGQRYVDGAPVVHTSLRKINIHKRTRERSLLRHCLHEPAVRGKSPVGGAAGSCGCSARSEEDGDPGDLLRRTTKPTAANGRRPKGYAPLPVNGKEGAVPCCWNDQALLHRAPARNAARVTFTTGCWDTRSAWGTPARIRSARSTPPASARRRTAITWGTSGCGRSRTRGSSSATTPTTPSCPTSGRERNSARPTSSPSR